MARLLLLTNSTGASAEVLPALSLLQHSVKILPAVASVLVDITSELDGVKHIDIDAEDNLELVRRLDIRTTPTTLLLDRYGIEVGRAVGAPKRGEVLASLATIK